MFCFSNVYGSSYDQADSLRLWKHGLLKFHKSNKRQMLPIDRNSEECEISEQGKFCFKAGL